MKLKQMYETKTYKDDEFYYCIEQKDPHGESHIIFLTIQQLRELLPEMQAAVISTEWIKQSRGLENA